MAKILVADDDKVMLGLMMTLMELEGDEVVTVTRPEDIVPVAARTTGADSDGLSFVRR
jgi:CheY-like chemotaxis protein